MINFLKFSIDSEVDRHISMWTEHQGLDIKKLGIWQRHYKSVAGHRTDSWITGTRTCSYPLGKKQN